MKLVAVILLAATFGLTRPIFAADPVAEVFKSGDHCVAYRTKKTMFLVKEVTVVGRNCDIVAKVTHQDEAQAAIRLSVPIMSFDSGDEDRDSDVLEILQASVQPSIIIETTALSKSDWQALWQSGEGEVDATITVAGESFPQRLSYQLQGAERDTGQVVVGKLITKFSDLKIEPPSVMGGVVADVEDYLELHWQLQVQKIAKAPELLGLQ